MSHTIHSVHYTLHILHIRIHWRSHFHTSNPISPRPHPPITPRPRCSCVGCSFVTLSHPSTVHQHLDPSCHAACNPVIQQAMLQSPSIHPDTCHHLGSTGIIFTPSSPVSASCPCVLVSSHQYRGISRYFIHSLRTVASEMDGCKSHLAYSRSRMPAAQGSLQGASVRLAARHHYHTTHCTTQ